ncbi:MAG: hypothetical protein A2X70_02040 [Alphaproteobacteria bacterium GWC2_42_16]|nr:MAG: hypothetical protein A2X70_02040 [Alphaproteobacteria bacterium GWC2_42_16]OFW73943.1 MAG: hypothetical protein A2Z80_03055 [Alphaproteobacteria bacterium GWA2_41_27]OFW82482.1 MAG: hypothetical protein A3E50_06980 [Alphaproteobacteria bacterium RIFCSPHIGHO2_12_FULL_42_100]OFW86599.1 MAG: hypothetical protein A2W06_07985 [Alphaproteobacteria bacterium RBG_16_42_14]OFW91493.1 MAG: hypothetical protein A3C41_07590 [Alphaproteobacteria bacterium RIFCSPHIGHO2_02_FULL_42_30]OFW93669.1 MAG: 
MGRSRVHSFKIIPLFFERCLSLNLTSTGKGEKNIFSYFLFLHKLFFILSILLKKASRDGLTDAQRSEGSIEELASLDLLVQLSCLLQAS